MQTATVSVTSLSPPGPGRTNWKMTGSDGAKYSVKPSIANQLRPGDSIAVDYEMYKDLRMVEKVSPLHNRPSPRPGVPEPYPNGIPAPQGDPRPEPPPHGSNHAPIPWTQAKEIFVTGVVGRAMGSGKFDSEDIKLLTKRAAESWDARDNG